jgi:hypothetical protein
VLLPSVSVMRTGRWSARLSPLASTVYAPEMRPVARNAPSRPVENVRSALTSVLRMVTVALVTTAPEGSVTRPTIELVIGCALAARVGAIGETVRAASVRASKTVEAFAWNRMTKSSPWQRTALSAGELCCNTGKWSSKADTRGGSVTEGPAVADEVGVIEDVESLGAEVERDAIAIKRKCA